MLSAGNGNYLYFLLLWHGNAFLFSFILFWGGNGDWGYLYFLSPWRGFLRVSWVAGRTFIAGYQSTRFWRYLLFISSRGYFISGYGYVFKDEGLGWGKVFTLLTDLGDTILGILCCHYSHKPTEGGRALPWAVRGGWWGWPWTQRAPSRSSETTCQGPGVSRHWGGSGTRGSSSSRSGDPLGISRITGGKSSRRMREVELSAFCWSSHRMREAKSAAGGSSPTSNIRSGQAERGSDCGWWDTEWQLLWGREIAPPCGPAVISGSSGSWVGDPVRAIFPGPAGNITPS